MSEVVREYVLNGDFGTEWTLVDLGKNLLQKNVDFATVLNNADLVVAVDSNYHEKVMIDNLHYIKTIPQITAKIIELLDKHNVNFNVIQYQNSGNFLMGIFNSLTTLFLGYFFIVFMLNLARAFLGTGSARPGSGNVNKMNPFSSFMQSGSTMIRPGQLNVTFSDVAGCDEAKNELIEVVDFLKDPDKFRNMGATVPKGVLLEGPPGTGKTLLARATAGEADVNFISASGSEFIEMFVGVGASRIRDMFTDARRLKPCIIFIDEIDAIGRQRGNGFSGGNDERDQTLNQLLTNMDGFDKDSDVIVMASTNRADILDKALTRAGRFDRKVTVGLPDREGRKEILKVHLKDKKIGLDVDLEAVYDLTPGFSGAELANLVNEAAIMAVRSNATMIDNRSMMDAYEKITIGLPKSTDTRDSETLEMVAYHESGHALVAKEFSEFVDVRKVTIRANNNGAGGYTLFTPKERFVSFPTKKYMFSQMVIAMAGRAAEILLYEEGSAFVDSAEKFMLKNKNIVDNDGPGDVTFGSSGDVRRAMELARQYINVFGAGNGIGAGSVREEQSEVAKGKVDERIAELIKEAQEKAVDILRSRRDELDVLSRLLIREKTVSGYQMP
tara:strand:+ start:7705 stop:9543 length:1839 start_codon:yes stop_codon:yes gene_type:complete